MRRLLNLFFIMNALLCSSQAVILESQVVDAKGEPLPFVHIYHDATRSGTISNLKGFFLLHIKTEDVTSQVTISSIGYQVQHLSVGELLGKNQITLIESVGELAAVTITPKNYALELLEKAIDRIPENYPAQREMNTGFTRELIYWEGTEDRPIYIAEAALESIKEDYSTAKSKRGDVRVKQGRKYESPQLDTLGIRFYGGLFDPFTMDDVYARSHALNQKNLKKYDLSISDTLRFQGKSLFIVDFKPKKETLPSGTLHIMDSSWAIVNSHFYYGRAAAKDLLDGLGGYQRQFQERRTEYYLSGDKKWRIKWAEYKTSFKKRDKLLNVISNYATTGIAYKFEEIPYQERSQYRDVFLDHTGEYDPDFWKNYNVIVPDPLTEELFRKQEDSQVGQSVKKQKVRFIDIARRINTAFGLSVNPVEANSHTTSFSNSEIVLNDSETGGTSSGIGMFSSIEYAFNPGFYIGYETTNSFKKKEYNSIFITLRKEFNLSRQRRPFFLSLGLSSGWQTISNHLGNFSFQNAFELDGKEFDSKRVDVFVQSRSFDFRPALTLEIEKSRTWHFFIRGYLNFPITTRTGLFFAETDQFFLKRKRKFLENDSNNVTVSTSNVFENDWALSFGIRFGIDL